MVERWFAWDGGYLEGMRRRRRPAERQTAREQSVYTSSSSSRTAQYTRWTHVTLWPQYDLYVVGQHGVLCGVNTSHNHPCSLSTRACSFAKECTLWRSTRAAATTRVLECYSSSKLLELFFTIRVLVNFYFRLQISISGCSFLQSLDELLEFMQTWGFAISFATCQPWNARLKNHAWSRL